MRYEINIDIHSITYNKDISIGFYKPRSIASNSASSSNSANSANNSSISSYLLLICTRSSRIVETSIHSFIFIQILVIDLDSTYWNESGRLAV